MSSTRRVVKSFFFGFLLLVPMLIGAFENVEIALEIGGPAQDTLKVPPSVAFDENGRIYIVDAGNYRVNVFAPDGSPVTKFGEKGRDKGQFTEPFGIACHDGRVFVTDTRQNTVQVFNSNGQYQYEFGGSGSDPGKLKSPKGIAVSGQGRLYVAESGAGRVSVFTTQGLYLDSLGVNKDNPGNLSNPTYIALDRTGNIYVSDARQNAVVVYDADGKYLRSIEGSSAGVEKLSGVAATPWGYLVLADSVGRIFLLDPKGAPLSPFGSPGSTRGQFKDIGGLAFGADGSLAVADTGNNRVEVLKARFPENAAVLPAGRSLPRAILETPILTPAKDVAVGGNGLVFALNSQNTEIKAFTRRGSPKFSMKPAEGKPGRIAAGGGRVYISDLQNNNVTAFNEENGQFLFKFGTRGKNPGELNSPGGMAVADKLYVADTGNDRVQIFSLDGVYLNTLGGAEAGFKKPSDVTVGPDKKIYVADAGNKRIVRFTPAGRLDGIIGEKEMFGQIVAIRLDEDGRIYVLEADGNERIRVLSSEGKVVMRLGARGSGAADFLNPGGMDFNRETIYLADTGNERVLRINIMDVPAEPAGLKISFTPDGTVMTWQKGTESFLKGYRIYAIDESGKKTAIGETEDMEFTVPYPLEGGQVRFTVSAFSRSGLESTPAGTLTDWSRIGWETKQAGKTDDAVAAFESALKANPKDPFALEQLGLLLITLKQYDRAKDKFEKLSTNRSYAEKAFLGLGMVAYEQGELDDAEKLLLKSISFNSQNAMTQRYLAEVYLKMRNWQKVLDHAREAAALDSMDPRTHELMGLAYFHMRLYEKAAKALGLAISLSPKDPNLYLELASVYRTQEQNKSAEDMLLKAIEVAPDDIEPMLALGTLYLETGRLDEADTSVNKILKAYPDSASAYRLKGKIFFARGKKEDAIEAFQKALSLEPDDPVALVSLSIAYLKLNQLDEAVKIMDRARIAHPQDESVLMASSVIREAQGDIPGAIADLDKVTAANPNSYDAFVAKGRLQMKRKEFQAAADSFKAASKLLPGSVEPLLMLAEALSGADRQVEAEEVLRDALNINIESAPAHYALGQLYAARTEYDKAIPELKLAAYIAPDNPEYHYALGKAFLDGSYLEEAVASLQRASDLKPDDEIYKRDLNMAMEALKKYRSSGNVPPVEIARVEVRPIFAGIAKSYTDTPIGAVTIKNNGREALFKVKVSFSIKGFMDQPTVTVVDNLKPRSSIEVPITVNLAGKALTIKDDTPVLGLVVVEYVHRRSPQKLSATAPFTLYGPNALIWSEKAMTGAFITPQDWPVAEFARLAVESAGQPPDSMSAPFFRSIAVYESLMAYKIGYIEDPNRPYRQSSKEIERVDYVQYPRDTLRLRSGDCDDLTVLFISLMENLGIETAIADLPGHVLPLVNAGITPDEIPSVAGDRNSLIEWQGQVWLPIEMTAIGIGFNEAWAQAAAMCRKAIEEGKFGLIETHSSWKVFAPATLPVTKWKPTPPPGTEVQKAVENQITMITRKRIDSQAAEILKRLEKNPGDNEARIELGILYARNGDLERARQEFQKVLDADPANVSALNNIGNIFFMGENFQAALEKYRMAENIAPDDAEIKINMAMTYYRMGDIDKAREKFEEGAEADPEIAEANEDLKELLFH